MYLTLHKNSKKCSIWTSRIFAAPANVNEAIQYNITVNDTAEENTTKKAKSKKKGKASEFNMVTCTLNGCNG